jgi:hypothetical protein
MVLVHLLRAAAKGEIKTSCKQLKHWSLIVKLNGITTQTLRNLHSYKYTKEESVFKEGECISQRLRCACSPAK